MSKIGKKIGITLLALTMLLGSVNYFSTDIKAAEKDGNKKCALRYSNWTCPPCLWGTCLCGEVVVTP